MSTTLKKTATLDYNTWSSNTQSNRNFVLYGTAMTATAATFSGTIKITDSASSPNTVASWSLDSTTGTTSTLLGHVDANPSSYTYPLNISANMTVSGSKLDALSDSSRQIGTKLESGNDVPISFETVIFFNDQGSDNDYNDCVLNFVLFNQSSD